jgi:hypothetical protein
MIGAGWLVLWTQSSIWNLVAFWALWTGTALLFWQASKAGYPGVRRHALLSLVSVPLWWWFEFVNQRTQNWLYIDPFDRFLDGLTAIDALTQASWRSLAPSDSSALWYALLSSLAFSTVVPAITSATAFIRGLRPGDATLSVATAGTGRLALGLGVSLQALVFVFPELMYPFVWVAPLLIVDGIATLLTGRSFVTDLLRGRWREAVTIAFAGLICGGLWEFWNYWSVPSWEYRVPHLGFWKLFEMPLLGYGGYIPFAWFIVRLVQMLDRALPPAVSRREREHALTPALSQRVRAQKSEEG